jgi:ATP-dependent RNA helicase DDX54/DBP10
MPTPVQRKALPVCLSGVDSVVMARTGSGKTCAFLIPLLEKLLATPHTSGTESTVRGIILSPTRELSVQTLRVLHKLVGDTDIRAIGIHGGEGMEKQFSLLSSKPDIIVATPGRLAHHLTEIPDFTLNQCQMCILDEADRLLEMGFAQQIRQIAKTIPENCQKLLFSATMPKVLVEFTKSGFAVDPTVVRLDNEATVSDELRIAFITCRSLDKDAALLYVLEQIKQDQRQHVESRTGLTLIFAATRHHVEYISTLLTASGIEAAMIYGTLDHEARKSNLAAFRCGKKPVLVVTDVAARGIDVPLIDHVIHYHFPPSPKLFVHRSGRAARAGRIGFCWGLVEPDELAYMVDLHLFLGRRLSTGVDENEKDDSKNTYTLDDMTPEMVHYGSIPEILMTEEAENVQRILNSELTCSQDAEALRALTKVCKNAMKQYRKTRSEASREGIRRAKAILEGERLETGQRLGGGSITPHPLLRAVIRKRQKNTVGLGNIENSLKREYFLRAMANFRPKETVFEAFATGGGKDVGIVSHVDKGRTTGSKKHDTSAALTAMKEMRRQMRISRDKGSTLMVAGSDVANSYNNLDAEESISEAGGDGSAYDKRMASQTIEPVVDYSRHRLTKVERRRLKKNGDSSLPSQPSVLCQRNDKKEKKQFRDPLFFIESEFTSNSEEAQRSRTIEAAMQPSAASSVKGSMGNALRIEEAMLDIVGDEKSELIQKQRMMRWDKAKRKYVQTTVGQELSGDSKSKKMRLESGQLVRNDKAKLGELYEKWQKKTNRSIGRSGVFDDADVEYDGTAEPRAKKKKMGGKASRDEKRDEPKSVKDIKKERAKKQNLKIKNMKKTDRRQLEQQQRKKPGQRTPGFKSKSHTVGSKSKRR